MGNTEGPSPRTQIAPSCLSHVGHRSRGSRPVGSARLVMPLSRVARQTPLDATTTLALPGARPRRRSWRPAAQPHRHPLVSLSLRRRCHPRPVSAIGAASPAADSEAAASPAAALEPWQTVALRDVRSGETFAVADLAGKLVVIEPMAIWCTNCARQQQEASKALAALDSDDVVYISLDVDPSERRQTSRRTPTNAASTGASSSPTAPCRARSRRPSATRCCRRPPRPRSSWRRTAGSIGPQLRHARTPRPSKQELRATWLTLMEALVSSFLLGLRRGAASPCLLPLYPTFLAMLATRRGDDGRASWAFLGLAVVLGVVTALTLVGHRRHGRLRLAQRPAGLARAALDGPPRDPRRPAHPGPQPVRGADDGPHAGHPPSARTGLRLRPALRAGRPAVRRALHRRPAGHLHRRRGDRGPDADLRRLRPGHGRAAHRHLAPGRDAGTGARRRG